MNRNDSIHLVRTTLDSARASGIPRSAMMNALFVEAMPLLLAEHGPERAARFLEQMAYLIRSEPVASS